MSIEANKAVIRRFYEEVWQKGNVDVAYEIFADDYKRNDFRSERAIPGPEGQKRIASDLRGAFPDLRWNIDLIIGEGDYVVGRWTMTGTNTGKWGDMAPTGKKAVYCGTNIFRLRNGKVVEIWNHRDDLGLMEQLGIRLHGGSVVDHKPK